MVDGNGISVVVIWGIVGRALGGLGVEANLTTATTMKTTISAQSQLALAWLGGR